MLHLTATEFCFRQIIRLPEGGKKKMATMALILTIYHCKYMLYCNFFVGNFSLSHVIRNLKQGLLFFLFTLTPNRCFGDLFTYSPTCTVLFTCLVYLWWSLGKAWPRWECFADFTCKFSQITYPTAEGKWIYWTAEAKVFSGLK